jgi:hypothetical protein
MIRRKGARPYSIDELFTEAAPRAELVPPVTGIRTAIRVGQDHLRITKAAKPTDRAQPPESPAPPPSVLERIDHPIPDLAAAEQAAALLRMLSTSVDCESRRACEC